MFDRKPLPPEGQLLLGVATDAWLPRGAGEAYEAVPKNVLFERLRIELFAPGEKEPCHECFRDFGIDHGTLNEGRGSVGFVPRPDTSGYRARVTLYHSGAGESSAEPRAASSIVSVVALPPVGADGITSVHVVLRTDELLRPRGTLDAPEAPQAGDPPHGLAGTWHQELARDCASAARPGEACVPGGAFWMGDTGFAEPFERLVALSPFFIDVHEVTVGEVRASGFAFLDAIALKADPIPYSNDAAKLAHYCTYTRNEGGQEDLPVNCVTRDVATKVCAKRGADLPSEAQFEFVAGARRDATFPWGEAAPSSCADAIYGRSYDAKEPPEFRMCVASSGVGVAKPGTGKLDRVRMPDGNEIVDLAANVAEWTVDAYQLTNESCYVANPAIDPVCRDKSAAAPDRLSVKGSNWTEPGGPFLRAAIKQSAAASVPQNPRIGFRCARHDG